ncbi:hypothetical protein H8D36_05870 [archaeon]|nr:hypothetical protein [archaeon]MBL7057552.1 hypothetical protein [Candidatus Woesearchaeota archaeon]
MSKFVKVIFSKDAWKSYQILSHKAKRSKKELIVFTALKQKIDLIHNNPSYGNQIPSRLIPKKYKQQDINNLFRVKLPCYWRMLYTITNKEEIRIIAFVLNIFNHKAYNKLMKYQNK